MFGSGKTTFARNFLHHLKSLAGVLEKLEKDYNKSRLNWLLGLEYVLVDFRYDLDAGRSKFVHALRWALARALLTKVSSMQHVDISKNTEELSNLSTDLSSSDIVSIFERISGRSFFLHLDEVDVLAVFQTNEQDDIRLWYVMWLEINALHKSTESEVYCSGRSPSLFLLGKGFLRPGKFMSAPENAECILLDPLTKTNVTEIFEVFLECVEENFIDQVHAVTSGVPRFVEHAVDFFTTRMADGSDEITDYTRRRGDFLLNLAPFTEYLNENAFTEMNPVQSMHGKRRDLYLELIRIAALRLPVQLAKTIEGEFWGFQGNVMTLDLCSKFPLYLEQWDDSHHVLVIPPIMLSTVTEAITDTRLPFWASLHKTCLAQAWTQSLSDVLEVLIQFILRLRVCEELRLGHRSVGQRLPFLAFLEDFIIATKSTCSYSDFRAFPRITRASKAGKSDAILRALLDNPASTDSQDVHPDDFPRLVQFIKEGICYVARPMSSSADLLFKITDYITVEMHFKNKKQQVNTTMMATELGKSCCGFSRNGQGGVLFVMMGLATAEGELPAGENVTDGKDKTILARRYRKGACFNEYVVPANLEVLVVLAAGMESLLTKEVVQILQKDGLDLTDMVLATRSPSRRSNKVDLARDKC